MIRSLDEVSAIVVSAGTSTLSAGYAGEDTPKLVIPTQYTHKHNDAYFGDNGVDVYRDGYDVDNTMSDSLSM